MINNREKLKNYFRARYSKPNYSETSGEYLTYMPEIFDNRCGSMCPQSMCFFEVNDKFFVKYRFDTIGDSGKHITEFYCMDWVSQRLSSDVLLSRIGYSYVITSDYYCNRIEVTASFDLTQEPFQWEEPKYSSISFHGLFRSSLTDFTP